MLLDQNLLLILLLAGGMIVLMSSFRRRQHHYPIAYPQSAGGCFGNILGFFGMLLSIGFIIYVFSIFFMEVDGEIEKLKPEGKTAERFQPAKEEKRINVSPESPPPKNKSPLVEDWGPEYSPDTNQRLNVGKLESESYSNGVPIENEILFENQIHNTVVDAYYYVQKVASPNEARAISAWNKWDKKYPERAHIGFDQSTASYPYKILIGPFRDRKEAKKVIKNKSEWIRNLEEETNIHLIEIK